MTSPSRMEREFHTLLTLAGARPETELPSQSGPEPEPDVASPTRTEREPTWPMLDGPASEPAQQPTGPCGPEPDTTSPSRTERHFHTLLTLAGARPEMSYQARAGLSRSRTWRVQLGLSGSLPRPCSTDLDRNRAPEARSRTRRLQVGWSGSSTHAAGRDRGRTRD